MAEVETDPDIELFYASTPNGWKISICLEEMELPYRIVPVALGQPADAAFLAVSPNGKIPAIRDRDGPGGRPIALFESGAILLYLAEKTGLLLPADPASRLAAMQWLFWQVGGLGPMAGQNGHFLFYAPERIGYAIERYGSEIRRLYRVLDGRLAETGRYVAGNAYSIADIACFPWIVTHKKQGLDLADYPALRRWFAELRARPAVQRGLAAGGGVDAMRRQQLDPEAKARLYGWGAGDAT